MSAIGKLEVFMVRSLWQGFFEEFFSKVPVRFRPQFPGDQIEKQLSHCLVYQDEQGFNRNSNGRIVQVILAGHTRLLMRMETPFKAHTFIVCSVQE
jgi:hypothetical protein